MTPGARRAVILGGTGMLGGAVARRLAGAGWDVTVTGRSPEHVPEGLGTGRARFVRAADHEAPALAGAVGDGCELLVDCACYTARDATALLALARRCASTVVLSSKAVYVDAMGRHANSPEHPRFDGPVTEDQPTMAPGSVPVDSAEGYGANKVAAELVLLDSGLPVTVLRVSKAHGRGNRRPREWVFVRRALERRRVVVLANRGAGVDQTSAAVNVASLVEVAARCPGARVLNAADPDAPSGLEISRVLAGLVGHRFEEVLVDPGAEPGLGGHPWDAPSPVVLDTSRALALGYEPVGTYAETVGDEVRWPVSVAGRVGLDGVVADDERAFFARFFDYAREDAYVASLRGPVA